MRKHRAIVDPLFRRRRVVEGRKPPPPPVEDGRFEDDGGALASAGFGTDEDYGYCGGEE